MEIRWIQLQGIQSKTSQYFIRGKNIHLGKNQLPLFFICKILSKVYTWNWCILKYGGVEGTDNKKTYLFERIWIWLDELALSRRISFLFGRIRYLCGRIIICSDELGFFQMITPKSYTYKSHGYFNGVGTGGIIIRPNK